MPLLNDDSLTFEFGPSGTAFYPDAVLELKWDKLQKIGVTEPVVLRWYNPDIGE